jgi:predicted house-cleaning noncanonical NTP pyrophosphatase (MazG superfamily)
MHFLSLKLAEEAAEFIEKPSIEELADVYEVLLSCAKSMGVSVEEISEKAAEKRRKNGGFDSGIILEKIEY